MPLTITLLKTPYEISFSGNPIPFSFALYPYTGHEQGQDIRLQIRVMVEDIFGSGFFTEVRSQNFYPTATGEITLDIQSILDPYLVYYTPRPSLTFPTEATNQRKRYKISWLLQQDGSVIGATTESSVFYVIKGGLSYEQWHPSDFFTSVIIAGKKPLLFSTPGIGQDETRFMYWVYPFADNALQRATYKLYLNDGTSVSNTLSTTVSGGKWAVFCISVRFNLTAISVLIPEGSTVIKYSIKILAGSTVIVDEFFFEIDYRNFYDTYQLLYRNSIGGLETLRLRGQVDFAADYDRQLAVRTVPPDYYNNLNLLAQTSDENPAETTKFTGDTGFMAKEQIEKLRDLFLSKQIVELQDGKFLPVILNTKTAKFYSNKENLLSAVVEWSRAFTNSYFTPDTLLPQSRTCPAVQSFVVNQVNRQNMQFMYALETPYDKIEVQVTIGADTYTFNYTGNTRNFIQLFSSAFTTGTIYVKARTICDETTGDYGPFTYVVLTVYGDLLPIANDDLFNIASGYNTPVALGSALANDYDPDGDAIEAVVASGATAAGGTYSIDVAGNVLYTPPSSLFTGPDSFTYNIRNVGGATNVPATVNINVTTTSTGGGGGGGLTGIVYVRWVPRNVVRNTDGSNIHGEYYLLFYSDPGSTLMDVTGMGITVNIRQAHFHQNSDGTTSTNNVDSSLLAFGTEYILYTGVFYNRVNTSPAPTVDTYTYSVLAGTGYVVI